MLEILVLSAILAYATLGIGHILGKICEKSGKCIPSSSSSSKLLYGEHGENYNKPIDPISPHNIISEVTKEGHLFVVTIKNTVTGDQKTLTNEDKWSLCMDADDVAFQFAINEREKYHTV